MLVPRFLDGPDGPVLAVGFVPAGWTERESAPIPWVLAVPPLFEELNKSRRTLALLGQALARAGVGCLLPDLFGTGDSAGHLRDATWEGWHENLGRAQAWLLERGATRIDAVALRGGALLAWDWLGASAIAVGRLALWQPIPSGRLLVNQLLRLRLAGALTGRAASETAEDLRARLAADGWLEIAGYALPAGLLGRLEAAELGAPHGQRIGSIDWYALIATPDQPLPAAATGCARAWSAAGLATEIHPVVGESFWSSQEIVEGRALVAATVARMTSGEALREPA